MAVKHLAIVGGIMAAGLASSAQATITFSPTNSPTAGEQTIEFEQQFSGQTSFFGDTNQTATPIQFLNIPGAPGGQTTIGTNAKGQADIVCTGGCGTDSTGGANGMQLTNLEVKIGAGFGATDMVGNLDFGEGTAQIQVTDQAGAIFDFVLTNGSNFFTLTAINGEVITDVQITEASTSTTPFGWNDFKQPRVSGICTLVGTTCTALPVPEPASLTLLGAALAGFGWLGWRRRKAA